MATAKKATKQTSRAARIRTMLADGMKPAAIAATMGITRQYVYSVRYYAKTRKAKLRLKNKQALRTRQAEKTLHKPIYVEVPVPQPVGHFSFWQRLRILFLGRASK